MSLLVISWFLVGDLHASGGVTCVPRAYVVLVSEKGLYGELLWETFLLCCQGPLFLVLNFTPRASSTPQRASIPLVPILESAENPFWAYGCTLISKKPSPKQRRPIH